MSRSQRKAPGIPAAIRSFLGYLEGSGKSAHTVNNYLTDLRVFQQFLEKGLGSDPVQLHRMTRGDLERYHAWLKSQGLKTNTRRRKILTVRRLIRHLAQRKKLDSDIAIKLPAPAKVERIPQTNDMDALISRIRELPCDSLLGLRNQVLFWTMAETGCLVSEVTRIRFEDWSPPPGAHSRQGARVQLGGARSPREMIVSLDLFRKVQQLQERSGDSPWLFLGFNKAGALGSPITPRGVELLVKARLEITPRQIRHSAVLSWFKEGIPRQEIRERLGLKTEYAFRVFEPLLKGLEVKSKTGTTSTS